MTARGSLLLALCVGCLVAPGDSHAQKPGGISRVGVLATLHGQEDYLGFTRAMAALGYTEGKNLVIEWRFADGRYDALPELAAELVRKNVAVLVAVDGTASALAARNATSRIPIVFSGVGDPVAIGLVKSLARPEGNITGLSNLASNLNAKQMEMLLRVAPGAVRLGVLLNPGNRASVASVEEIRLGAKPLGLQVLVVEARTAPEVETAFALLERERAQCLLLLRDVFFYRQRDQIAALGAKYRLPTAGGGREYAEAGVLLSYGQSREEYLVRAAGYAAKILDGARPVDLPVEQPTKVELVVNKRTAKALGMSIPPELLLMADKVIE